MLRVSAIIVHAVIGVQVEEVLLPIFFLLLSIGPLVGVKISEALPGPLKQRIHIDLLVDP